MMKLALALLLTLAGCARGTTVGPATEREAVAAAISGRHFDPDDPPEITRAAGSAETLLSLARDPGEHHRYVAERAASLLRHHPTPEVYAGLLELARDGSGGVREAALVSLGRAFTKAHARELAELAERHLEDDDPGVGRAARELLVRAKASRFTAPGDPG
jgi:HEAT repeat protein